MKWAEWIEQWGMTGLKINAGFLQAEWEPKDPDKDAAWEMYIELLTRVSTQALPIDHGDEKTALESIYSLFPITREIIKKHGKHCNEFAKIAIIVLNQVIRPFTAKWHRLSLQGAFDDPQKCEEFRNHLEQLQGRLKAYTKMLADMAGVEDLTSLEVE